MTPDSELLRRFAKTNSEDAFCEVVRRHVNLVYSVAMRRMNGDEHLAKDVAQTVFVDLARKAAALSRHSNLAGWLYTSAYFAGAKIARTENRRREREEKFMREPISDIAPDADWEKIRPTLDDAMHELKESDRQALLLRYFENRQYTEVGAKLGLNENAARMRVERALEKLRALFAKRGIATTVALASVISANAVQTAPASLATVLTTASVTVAGTGTFTLLKIMTLTQLKFAAGVIVVAGAATLYMHQQQIQNKLHAENDALGQQLTQLQSDDESLSNRLADAGQAKSLSDDQIEELLKLRGEVGVLREQTNGLEEARQQNLQLRAQLKAVQSQPLQLSPDDRYTLDHEHAIQAIEGLASAMHSYAEDHNGQFPDSLSELQTPAYLGSGSLPDNAQLDDYELMNTGVVNDGMTNTLVFRQITPYQRPDGEWVREYGLASGTVTSQYSTNGDYGVFEQQHSATPSNQ